MCALAVLLAGCAGAATVSPPTGSAMDRATELQRTCQYDAAHDVLVQELGVAKGADRAMLLVALGSVAEHRGDRAAALEHYQEAVQADAVPLAALEALGMSQVQDRQYEAGLKNLHAFMVNRVRAGHPPPWWVVTAAAVAFAETNRLEEAGQLLDGALEKLQFTDAVMTDLNDLVKATRAGGGRAPGRFWQLAYEGTEFASAMDVDYSPVPRERMAPTYPRHAARNRIEGRVELDLQLDEQGNVVSARVRKAEPKGVFERVTLDTVRQWKFRPAMRKCKPVATRGTQVIEYRMQQ
jgi:TonB family protein